MNSESDYVFNVVIVGDSCVGKTTMLRHFSGVKDVGVNKDSVEIQIVQNGRKVLLKICDTMGQERFRSLTTSFYRCAKGVILCYSETVQESFQSLETTWLPDIEQRFGNEVPIVLVGIRRRARQNNKRNTITNKTERSISREDSLSLSSKYKMPYIPVDLSKEEDIHSVFQKIVDLMIERLPDMVDTVNTSIKLGESDGQQTTGSCGCRIV